MITEEVLGFLRGVLGVNYKVLLVIMEVLVI